MYSRDLGGSGACCCPMAHPGDWQPPPMGAGLNLIPPVEGGPGIRVASCHMGTDWSESVEGLFAEACKISTNQESLFGRLGVRARLSCNLEPLLSSFPFLLMAANAVVFISTSICGAAGHTESR